MRLTERVARALLVAILVCDTALLLVRAHAQRELRIARSPFAASTRALPLPSGFRLDGSSYESPEKFNCALLQFTSTHCQYCAAQRTVASLLSAQLAGMGCVEITMAPAWGEMPISGRGRGQIELAFVRPGWLKFAPQLQLEPTTIVLGNGGKILWYEVGEMNGADAKIAVAKLNAAQAHR
ncbi:MAG: hypothetical protein ACRD1M_06130 [Terriglobales bacterium]